MAAEVDVVLMDINLPGMSGVEALAALRARASRCPVRALTALRDARRPRAAARRGLRRLPGEAGRRARAARRRSQALTARDPRRRRPAAERAAAAGGARAARATRWPRPSSGAEALTRLAAGASTSSCSTSSCRGWTATRSAARSAPTRRPRSCRGDDHGVGRAGEAARARGRRRRLHRQAVRPGRAARPRALAAARSSATTTSSSVHRGLRRFLPPEVADLVKADPSVLETHRREVAVRRLRLGRLRGVRRAAPRRRT